MYPLVILAMTSCFFSLAQQKTITHTQQRRSFSQRISQKFFDAEARRLSLTIQTQPVEQIGVLPDIADIPYAFPPSCCTTPIASTRMLLVATSLQKQQSLTSKNMQQKKSSTCCTIM